MRRFDYFGKGHVNFFGEFLLNFLAKNKLSYCTATQKTVSSHNHRHPKKRGTEKESVTLSHKGVLLFALFFFYKGGAFGRVKSAPVVLGKEAKKEYRGKAFCLESGLYLSFPNEQTRAWVHLN